MHAGDALLIVDWKTLYELAIVEPDTLKLPGRIADARRAIIERIEATLAEPHTPEHQELNDALKGLRVIHQEYERRLQRLPMAGNS
jgi:hypothetical protein